MILQASLEIDYNQDKLCEGENYYNIRHLPFTIISSTLNYYFEGHEIKVSVER